MDTTAPRTTALRTLLITGVLILALVGLIQLNAAAANWHYITTGSAGDLLYAAAFDGLQDEWEQYNERRSAVIDGGVIRLTNNEVNNGNYSVTKARFADFDLAVTGSAVAGPENNGYGVIYRLQDRSNYYTFMVSSDGYYQVTRVVNGDVTELSTWIESPVVNMGIGAVNRLRVVARGDQFEFYVNEQRVQVCVPNNPAAQSMYMMDTCIDGQMLDTLTDASIAQGQLGVVIQTIEGADAGVSVEFDNLIVMGS